MTCLLKGQKYMNVTSFSRSQLKNFLNDGTVRRVMMVHKNQPILSAFGYRLSADIFFKLDKVI